MDAALDDAASVLATMGLSVERLRGPTAADLLWRATNPGESVPALLTGAAADLATVLPPLRWMEHLDHLQVGGRYLRSLLVMEPPDVTDPGWLDDLLTLDVQYRLSWHLRGRDRDRERRRQLRRRKTLYHLATSGRITDLDSEGASQEAEQLAEEMVDFSVGISSSTLVLTLQAPTLGTLNRATRQALRVLRTRYGAFGRGRGHQRALWQSSLPYGLDTSRRARRWHSASIGNGLPFLAHSPGMATGFPLGFTTRGGELVALDLSHPSLPNWVTVVLGRQGSGKTFVSQLFVLWTLYQNGRATIIDRAGRYRALISLRGGSYVALGKDPLPPTINPWDLRPGEDLRQRIDTLLTLHEIMLTRPGQELDARSEAAPERAIKAVYATHAERRALAAAPSPPSGPGQDRASNGSPDSRVARHSLAPSMTVGGSSLASSCCRMHAAVLGQVLCTTVGIASPDRTGCGHIGCRDSQESPRPKTAPLSLAAAQLTKDHRDYTTGMWFVHETPEERHDV